jgi:hypothetical protein
MERDDSLWEFFSDKALLRELMGECTTFSPNL